MRLVLAALEFMPGPERLRAAREEFEKKIKETPYIERAVEIGIRKIGWITETADRILERGGLTTELGVEAVHEFDRKLQSARGEYNPGTTADLTAGSLFVALLCGLGF